MGHRITATERVDGADFKVTLEKGGDGQYHEIDRRPLPAGIVARTIRAPLRFAGWLLRWPRLICGWPLRALRGQWGNAACWLERTWADTDPALDVVPAAGDASLPTDEQLKGVGLSDDAIARLRKNPASFPHTLRKFGFNFGRVRGTGLAGRAVGSVHFIRHGSSGTAEVAQEAVQASAQELLVSHAPGVLVAVAILENIRVLLRSPD